MLLTPTRTTELGSWATEQCESANNAGANLVVLCFGVAVAPEFWRLAQQATYKPRSVSLALVRYDGHIQTTTLGSSAAYLRGTDTAIHQVSNIPL